MMAEVVSTRTAGNLHICLFGQADVRVGRMPLPPLRYRKDLWVLALLALKAGQEVSRSSLAATLWPDADETQGLYYLRRSLTNLRQSLGGEAPRLLSPMPRTLRLDTSGVFVDVAAFDNILGRNAAWDGATLAKVPEATLTEAIALYRGPLLLDCADEWVLPERIAREQAYLATLEALAARLSARGSSAEAVRPLRLLVAADPYRESAYAALMRALAKSGDRAAVRVVYQTLRATLRADLSSEPSPETQALYRQLTARMSGVPSFVASSPPSVPADAGGTATGGRHLPVPLSDLVGREAAVSEVTGWLGRCRLVTLTGTGGVGKTRLSIAAAENVLPHFPDGVWFVELAPLTDPARVVDAVAQTLSVTKEAGREVQERLVEALASRRLLLVLDNCEHLLEACASLVFALLSACPDLRVLATSRQPLGLTGEQCWAVPPLETPPAEVGQILRSHAALLAGGEKDPTSVLEYASVRLFVERARQADLGFRLSRRSAPTIADICRRLDGIPLALEMAAARTRSHTTSEILARLEDRFRLLTTGPHGALPRHQTLRATLDWSFDLLSSDEQTVLRRASVFADGWTLEAAEQVCGGAGVATTSVREWLTCLTDKSLMVRHAAPDSEARFHLLETVRQYAAERLEESGEASAVRGRHFRQIMHFLGSTNPQFLPGEAEWLRHVDTEYANVRVALDWGLILAAADDDAAVEMLRLTQTLWLYWTTRALFREGRNYTMAALDANLVVRATNESGLGLVCAAHLCSRDGHGEVAYALIQERIQWCRTHGEDEGLIHALFNLHSIYSSMQDVKNAISVGKQVLAEIKRAQLAGSVSRERLHLFQGGVLGNLARDKDTQKEYKTAVRLLQKSIAAHPENGPAHWRAGDLVTLGQFLLRPWPGRDITAAAVHLRAGLSLSADIGSREDMMIGVCCLAQVSQERGHWRRAVQLLGAASSLAQRHELSSSNDGERAAQADSCRTVLGKEAFSAAWAEGEAMTTEQTVEYALEENASASS